MRTFVVGPGENLCNRRWQTIGRQRTLRTRMTIYVYIICLGELNELSEE